MDAGVVRATPDLSLVIVGLGTAGEEGGVGDASGCMGRFAAAPGGSAIGGSW